MNKTELALALIKSFANILYSIESVEIKPRDTLFDPVRKNIKINIDEYGEIEKTILNNLNLCNQLPLGIQKVGDSTKKLSCILHGYRDFEDM